jgi:hypothetical protein
VIYARVYISMACTVDGDLRLFRVRDEGSQNNYLPHVWRYEKEKVRKPLHQGTKLN